MIGSLGEVCFEVSGQSIKTFDDMRRNASARLATHELINRKPLTEFVGAGLETISLSIALSAFYGIDPIEEVKVLREMRDKGMAVPFILDGQPQGDGLWLLESLEEEWHYIDNYGCPRVINCSCTLKEYIEDER